MVNNKKKGSRVELDVVHFLKAKGVDCHRTNQFCGKNGGKADIEITDKEHRFFSLHHEVKGTKSYPTTSTYLKWLKQVEEDSKGKPWLIWHKQNNLPLGVILQPSTLSLLTHMNVFGVNIRGQISCPVKALNIMVEENKIREEFYSLSPLSQASSVKWLPIVAFKVKDDVLGYCLAESLV